MENKAFEFDVKDGFFFIKVDPNKDGEPLMELKIDLKEVPDEVIDALNRGKG